MSRKRCLSWLRRHNVAVLERFSKDSTISWLIQEIPDAIEPHEISYFS